MQTFKSTVLYHNSFTNKGGPFTAVT